MMRLAWALVLLGCAAPVRAMRPRGPSRGAALAAFEALDATAVRCLGPDDRVTVEGFFEGATGRYFVERVGVASPRTSLSAQQCVANVMERARVPAFAAERSEAVWTVHGAEVSAAVRAMLSADASVGPAGPVLGGSDARAVLVQVRAQTGALRRCYDDARVGRPSLAGRVEVRLTLSVDGRVTGAVANVSRGMREVGVCALGVLRALAWPAARGASVDFAFPFQFDPPRDDAGT